MKNLPLLLGTIIGTLALIVGVVFFFSRSATQSTVTDQDQLITDAPHIKGSEDALVTIVEFSDFQCPACRSTEPLLQSMIDQYPDQVRLIYRHFPLNSIHPNAQLAAQAAEAAGEEGQFWPYHDRLFAQQDEWAEISNKDEFIAKLGDYAEELGIDKAVFLEKIESDHIKSLVIEDITAGGQLNIQGTPTLYVNGQQTPASQLPSRVESLINNQ